MKNYFKTEPRKSKKLSNIYANEERTIQSLYYNKRHR